MSVTSKLLERLGEAGFSESCVRAALPTWWSAEEENSSSAQTLVTLLLARRLSIDPESLLDDGVPIGFLHTGPTKFKHLRLADGPRLQALTAFAQGVSRILFSIMGVRVPPAILPNARALRDAILESGRPHVAFGDVLTLCWSLNIPVLHMRLFPARAKGITAMTVRIADRHAILVARESGISAQYMFHIAHELGHVVLGHLGDAAAIVDADPDDPENSDEHLIDDDEERAADAFAQELLSGMADFKVLRAEIDGIAPMRGTAKELARHATNVGQQLSVDPAHIVMCFGQATGEWGLAQAAAKLLPDQSDIPGNLVNRVFWDQLGTTDEEQSIQFLKAVASL